MIWGLLESVTPATISLIIIENQPVGKEKRRITLDIFVFLDQYSIDISSSCPILLWPVELSDEHHIWSQFRRRETMMILESVL